MAARELPRRRFVTRHDVEDAAAQGRAIDLEERDVLTAEAAQRARDLGVRVGSGGVARATASSTRPETGRGTDADLRRAVRAAVVAELGSEPVGLDDALDRVLRRRG
jgi:hypothetical protein